MEREREWQLYQLQADLCHVLADPTRLELLHLLGERPRAVKALIEITGQRQSKISQHLAVMRQRLARFVRMTVSFSKSVLMRRAVFAPVSPSL